MWAWGQLQAVLPLAHGHLRPYILGDLQGSGSQVDTGEGVQGREAQRKVVPTDSPCPPCRPGEQWWHFACFFPRSTFFFLPVVLGPDR